MQGECSATVVETQSTDPSDVASYPYVYTWASACAWAQLQHFARSNGWKRSWLDEHKRWKNFSCMLCFESETYRMERENASGLTPGDFGKFLGKWFGSFWNQGGSKCDLCVLGRVCCSVVLWRGADALLRGGAASQLWTLRNSLRCDMMLDFLNLLSSFILHWWCYHHEVCWF